MMAPQLSTKPIISRDVLAELGDARLSEAKVLLKAGHPAAAIYLAGYAVECCLKAVICTTLGWDDLSGTFRTHDLESLMLHSGFDSELRKNPPIVESFAKIVGMWVMDGPNSIRYQRPCDFDASAAEQFLSYVSDPLKGVVPWLQKATS